MNSRRLAFQVFEKTLRLGWRMRKGIPLELHPFIAIIVRFLSRHLTPSGIYLIESQGHKMYLDSRDVGISAALLVDGVYEECETNLIKSIVKERMICADLGAHVGYYTLLMAAQVGENGKVFAFEPAPDNYALLLKNIEVNGYRNVIPIQKAVSNQSGIAKMFLSADTARSNTIWDTHDSRESIAVDMVSLDDFFIDTDHPNVIKVDIEGAEMKALRGMSRLITQSDDLKMIVEVHTKGIVKAGSSPAEFVHELIKYGFKLSILEEPKRVRPADEAEIISLSNSRQAVTLFCEKKAQGSSLQVTKLECLEC